MIDGAWRTGEPGCFFIDEANRFNPVPHLGTYEATNPCGEQPLLAYDVCNLGSINVGYYVKDGAVDWDAFRSDIHLSTHFLDNIIDVNKYPLAEIDTLSKSIRRIGLGLMGFADLLVRLGVPYDSDEGVELGRKMMEFLDVESKKESERLAKERGPFPEWERSIWGPDETCARDPNGQAHPPDADAAQLQRDHDRAHGHDLASSPDARRGSSRSSRSPSCATRPAPSCRM